jgi:hypothetical protein
VSGTRTARPRLGAGRPVPPRWSGFPSNRKRRVPGASSTSLNGRKFRPARKGADLAVVGALGMELVDGWYAWAHGEGSVPYVLLSTMEKLLQMAGVVVFARPQAGSRSKMPCTSAAWKRATRLVGGTGSV